MTTHSSTPAWKIPWTGGPGGLKFMASLRVRHNWRDLAAAAAFVWNTLQYLTITTIWTLLIILQSINWGSTKKKIFSRLVVLKVWSPKCGPWINNTSITSELVRTIACLISDLLNQKFGMWVSTNLCFNGPPGDLVLRNVTIMVKLELLLFGR